MAREALITVSDTHVNSEVGLCLPGLLNDDGSPNQLNKIQKWLWHTWERCWNEVTEFTEGYWRNIAVVGDAIELDTKARSWQIVSHNPSNVQEHAQNVYEPIRELADIFFVLRGTEAHTGGSAHGEEELARDLDAEKCPDTETFSWWHLRSEFGGVAFDLAHHHSMGILPHTYANAANKLAFNTMWDYYDWGEEPPDCVVRAHNHRYADSGRTYRTRAFFNPAWQYHTAYLHRLGKPNARPHIGVLVWLCDNGEYSFHDFRYRPVRSKRWKRRHTK